jgi:hypothetical protein
MAELVRRRKSPAGEELTRREVDSRPQDLPLRRALPPVGQQAAATPEGDAPPCRLKVPDKPVPVAFRDPQVNAMPGQQGQAMACLDPPPYALSHCLNRGYVPHRDAP